MLPSAVQGRMRMAGMDKALQKAAEADKTRAAEVFTKQLQTMNLA